MVFSLRAGQAATSGRSVGVVTALTPYLGYASAAEIARAAMRGEGDVRELVLASGALSAEDLDVLLTTESLTQVGGLGDVLPGDPILVAESMVCAGRREP